MRFTHTRESKNCEINSLRSNSGLTLQYIIIPGSGEIEKATYPRGSSQDLRQGKM